MIGDICDFFELSSSPFDNSLNQNFYFDTATHSEALKALEYTLESNKGIALIYGVPGTGKTFLSYAFKTQAIKNGHVVLESDQLLRNENHFLSQLALKLKIKSESHEQIGLSEAIKVKLLAQTKRGKSFIVIVDEAQEMDDNFFALLRSINNIESENRKLVQIVLLAQPTIINKLARPEFDSLRQRIAFKQELRQLSKQETIDYIHYRIKMADGDEERTIFHESALNVIFNATKGVPRLINEVCGNCLVAAFHKDKKTVNESIAKRALESSLTISIENQFKLDIDPPIVEKRANSSESETPLRSRPPIPALAPVNQVSSGPDVYHSVLTPASQVPFVAPTMKSDVKVKTKNTDHSWLKDNFPLIIFALIAIIALQYIVLQLRPTSTPIAHSTTPVPSDSRATSLTSVITEKITAENTPGDAPKISQDQRESDDLAIENKEAAYDYFELAVPKTE
ncbi:MAG: MSHA biogenesis protein MshM [Paracoccaceae bacterium]|jgi:MSHA biogenesis protein MshM